MHDYICVTPAAQLADRIIMQSCIAGVHSFLYCLMRIHMEIVYFNFRSGTTAYNLCLLLYYL